MYQFTEDCIIGIREIDQQHEKLFELINEILELLHNDILQDKHHQVQNILEELKEYADIHFVSEEAYMAAITVHEALDSQCSPYILPRPQSVPWYIAATGPRSPRFHHIYHVKALPSPDRWLLQ